MKILIAKFEVAGYFRSLSSALTTQGYNVSTYFVRDHPFYPDHCKYNRLLKISRILSNIRDTNHKKKILKKLPIFLLDELVKVFVIMWISIFFNKVIFTYGQDISGRSYEPFFYKIFNVEVVFIFLGSDIRPPNKSNKFMNSTSLNRNIEMASEVKRIKKVIRLTQTHRALILSYPTYSFYLPDMYYDLLSLGVPVADASIISEKQKADRIRVCHIPSNRLVKGTAHLLEIFEDLQWQLNGEVEFVVISEASNHEVRSVLAECDIVITELSSDTPCPLIAIEACAEGCIPIVCGAFSKDFTKYYDTALLPPYPYIDKLALIGVLTKLVRDTDAREHLRSLCLQYYRDTHSFEAVGKKFSQFFESKTKSTFIKFMPNDLISDEEPQNLI